MFVMGVAHKKSILHFIAQEYLVMKMQVVHPSTFSLPSFSPARPEISFDYTPEMEFTPSFVSCFLCFFVLLTWLFCFWTFQ
jgi:hypothetical protein